MRTSALFVCVALLFASSLMGQHEKDGEASKHPFIGNPTAIEAGQKQFATGCAACHGADGGGGRGPSLRERAVWHPMDDKTLYDAIQKGIGGGMPAANLEEDKAWQIVAYVRSLTSPASQVAVPGNAATGSALFNATCAGCHRVSGKGGFRGPDLSYIGGARTASQLRIAIVDPQYEISPGYQHVSIVMNDGRKLEGAARNRTNYALQLQTADGNVHLLNVGGIREMTIRKTSTMPSFREKLSRDDLQNVIAYLATLSTGPVAKK